MTIMYFSWVAAEMSLGKWVNEFEFEPLLSRPSETSNLFDSCMFISRLAMNSLKKCAVPSCAKVRLRDRDVKYHAFPKDDETRSKWIQFCGGPKHVQGNRVICSLHFDRDCYEGFMMKDLGFKLNLKLRPGSIPTLRKDPVETSYSERVAKRSRKKLVEELLQSTDEEVVQPIRLPDVQFVDVAALISEKEEEAPEKPGPVDVVHCCGAAAQVEELKRKISDLEQENVRLRMKSQTNRADEIFLEDVKELLKGYLSPEFIDIVLAVKRAPKPRL